MSRLFLVRHADAGDPSLFTGDDRLRPLTTTGHAQAVGIAEQLAESEVARVFSSPSLRCIETIAPLALLRGLDIVLEPRLHEDADPAELVTWLLSLGDGGSVAASHGEPLGPVVRLLAERGGACDEPIRCKKGSTWVVDVEHAAPVRLRYTAAP